MPSRNAVTLSGSAPAASLRSRSVHSVKVLFRAPLGAGFGEGKRAVVELEQRERDAPWRLRLCLEPTQAPGDHQVQHQVQRALQHEHDALADAPDLGDTLAP